MRIACALRHALLPALRTPGSRLRRLLGRRMGQSMHARACRQRRRPEKHASAIWNNTCRMSSAPEVA